MSKDEIRGAYAIDGENEELVNLNKIVNVLVGGEPAGKPSVWLGGNIQIPNRMIDMKTIDRKDSHFTDLINPDKRKEWIEETSDQIVTLIKDFNRNCVSLLSKSNFEFFSSNDSNALLSKTQQ